MRPERVAKLLRLGCEPGAVVDERPAGSRRYRTAFFVLAAAFAAATAWYAQDVAHRKLEREESDRQIRALDTEVRRLRGILNMISDPKARTDGGSPEDQEERR